MSTTSSATLLAAGSYSVTATDANGCPGDTTFTITEPTNGITFGASTQNDIACQGDSTGKIFVIPSGGSGVYTNYAWSPAVSVVDSAVNLWQGNFTVTVTDNGGCFRDTTFTIGQPANLLTASFINKSNPTCVGGGSDGEIHVLSTNGNRPYSYDWGGSSGTSTSVNDSARKNMSAGIVNVTVTDFTGCTFELEDTLVTPGNLFVSFTDTILPTCFGDTNGRLIATHTGGNGSVSYTWTATQGSKGSNDSIWINAKSELISVEVEDALGCKATASLTLSEPDSITFSPVITDVGCKGDSTGKIVLMVSGGNSGYAYQWSPTGLGTADSIVNLWTGNFTVTVTDDSLCTKDTTIFIDEPATLLSVSIAKSSLDCFSDTIATASATPIGGSGTYSYSWDSGTAGASDSLRVDLRSGEFNVTVTDLIGGCSVEITDTILAPDSLYGTFTQVTQPGCGSTGLGSIIVTPVGGTPGYTYTWIGGGINGTTDSVRINVPSGLIQVVVSDSKGCPADTLTQNLGGVGVVSPVWSLIEAPKCTDDSNGALIVTPMGGSAPYNFVWNFGNTGISDSARIDLPSGVQIECIVTDNNGCFDTAKISFTNPIPISLTFTDSVSPLCAGDTNGSITVTPLGGTKPYSYLWNNSDVDSVGNNLGGGIYHIVTVTDDKGCEKIDSASVSDPLPVTATFTDSTSVTCWGGNNGSLTVTPSNGVPIYTYTWSASDGSTVQKSTSSDSIAVDLFGDITYTVTISDGNSCEGVATKTIDEPNRIQAIVFSNAGQCDTNGGEIRVPGAFIRGGTAPYTVTYDSNGTVLGTGNILTGLWPGVYGVTIEDSKGCTRFYTEQVENRFGPRIFLNNLDDATCEGVCDGEIDIRVQSFNNIPVTYLWSNGDTTQDIINQCTGPYNITVTDTNGCVRIGELEIGVQDTLLVDLVTTPLSCNTITALCDATVSSSSPNGVGPYSYKWSTSVNDTLLNIPNLCAGTYLHTITDSRGCVAQDSATIDPSAVFTVSTSMDSVSCFGGNDGVARVASVNGGSTPYSYLWSTSANDTNSVNSGLSAGTYYVTVSGSGSCSLIDTVEVLQPSGMSFSYTTVLANCGQSDGVVTANVSGGLAPYSYNWPIGGIKTSNVDSFYSANAYNVIVTDAKGCSSTFPFNMSNSGGAVVTLDSIKHETCVGSCDGAIYVSVLGGAPNYLYSWSPGGSKSQDTVNACPGNYDLQVIDQNNCITLFSDTIETATLINSNITVLNHATTVGSCDGIAQVTPTGGAGGYQYLWSSGSTSDTANSLCAGFVKVTITDAKGCFIEDSIEITEPLTLVLDSTQKTDATCQAVPCDGTATVFVSGGSGTYTYLWDNGDTSPTTTARCAGTATVTVSDGSISTPFSVRIFETNSSVVQTKFVQDVSCNGGIDGKAYVELVSGQPITSWSWSPAGGNTDTANGLPAGFYTVSATNSLGCTSSDTITISEPTPIVGAYDTISSTCGASDGFIIAQVSGGTPIYTINWLDASQAPLSPTQTGDTARNLSSGIYHYEVIDSKGCSKIVQTILNDKNAPIVTLDSLNDVSCYGVCDGDIYISATGGTGILSYNWMPGAISTPDLTNSCADIYTLQVTDGSGCSTSFVDTIKSADSLDINLTKLNDISAAGLCDGSASASVTGGQPNYTFMWTGGGSNSLSNTLCEGINYVTVTDSKGCFGIDSIEILKPAGIILTQVDTTMPACGVCDGKIKITASGGLSPYTYKWDNGDTADSTINRCAGLVFVTVTDATGSLSGTFSVGLNNVNGPTIQVSSVDVSCNSACDGSAIAIASLGTAPYTYKWPSIGKTDSNIVNLCKGTYQVEVRDAIGCITTDSVVIDEPTKIVASVTTTIADCGKSNGSATISLVGGVTPYKFTWLPAGTVTTVPTIAGLPAGAYSVLIEDSILCSETIPFGIDNPTGPTVTIDTAINESCDGSCNGSIFITASGTAGPYSYKWLPGGSTSEDVSNLCAGVYTVEVTDGNQCVTVAMDTIEGPATPTRTVTVVSHVQSFGKCEGKAFVEVTGGNSGYSFQWSSSEVGDTARALCAGVNYITITNPDGCQFFDSLIIREPQPLIIATKSVTEPNCNICDGKITVSVVGGTPPYTFKWDNGDAADSTTKRCAGTAFLTVTDANNYTVFFQLAMSNTTSPTVTIISENDKCANTCEGIAVALGSGTLAPYSYNWPTLGVQSDTAKGLCAGTYQVEVTDKVGCVQVETVTIDAPPAMTFDFAVMLPRCKTASGAIAANVKGGTPKTSGYDYLWLDNQKIGIIPAQTSNSLLNIAANLYYLAVTDSNNCMDTASVTLNNIGGAAISLDSIKNVTCTSSCDGEIKVSTAGLFDKFKWLPSEDTTRKISGLCAGQHTVQVTDTAGCLTTSSFNITAPTQFNVIASKIEDATCINTNDGAIITFVNEPGTYTYSWTGSDNFSSTSNNLTNVLAGDYELVVTNSDGCVDSLSESVGAQIYFDVIGRTDSTYCGEQTIPLAVSVIGSGYHSTVWYDANGFILGRTDTIAALHSKGINEYTAEVREQQCVVYDTIVVTIQENYIIDAGKDRTIIKGQKTTLGGVPTISNGGDVIWTPDENITSAIIENPTASPEETTTYIVSSGLDGGCLNRDTVVVKVEDKISVNNAISPNGDGVNDTWTIGILNDYPNASVKIVNRWGQTIYDVYPYIPWDGTYEGEQLQLGTYYYIIDLKDSEIENPILTGPITIIR
ncbi:MAG: gliding motility-associated C-terminal domain-containing protein [Salibacteraceae bacterium]